jgi:hypothetical protein
MRPRRRILLVDPDADRRTINRFVLDIWGYRVFVAGNERAAAAVMKAQALDLVVGFAGVNERKVAAHSFRHAVTSLMARGKGDVVDAWCDRILLAPSMTELRETVKVLTRRKRGPKKGFKRNPLADAMPMPLRAAEAA